MRSEYLNFDILFSQPQYSFFFSFLKRNNTRGLLIYKRLRNKTNVNKIICLSRHLTKHLSLFWSYYAIKVSVLSKHSIKHVCVVLFPISWVTMGMASAQHQNLRWWCMCICYSRSLYMKYAFSFHCSGNK